MTQFFIRFKMVSVDDHHVTSWSDDRILCIFEGELSSVYITFLHILQLFGSLLLTL